MFRGLYRGKQKHDGEPHEGCLTETSCDSYFIFTDDFDQIIERALKVGIEKVSHKY